MTKSKTISFSLTLALTLAAACGSDSKTTSGDTGTGGASSSGGASSKGDSGSGLPAFDAGSDPNRNKVTAGGLCTRLVEIQCAGEQHCCTNPGRDVAACKDAETTNCNQLSLDDVAKDPITAFDAAKAEAAFAAFEKKASACDPTVAEFGVSATGLRGIVDGTIAVGGTCNPADGSSLSSTTTALASCKDPSANACLPVKGGDWKCTARAGAGSKCFSDANCTDGLYCGNPDLNIEGDTCKARKAAGETCKLANECDSFGCSDDGKCKPKGVQTAYCLGG